MVKEIELSQGFVALVDDQDYEFLNQFSWSVHGSPRSKTRYARRGDRRADGRVIFVTMHRQIMCPPKGVTVDHVNQDGLDNRKANLRYATSQQNSFNRTRVRTKSPYRGVRLQTRGGGWQAHIRVDGHLKALGTYRTAEEAARVYDQNALKHQGSFAVLNFPEV